MSSMLASLALVLILIDASLAIKIDNLDNVCSKTNDKNLCKGLMKTHSASLEDSDYGTLCKNAVDVAFNTANEIFKLFANATFIPNELMCSYIYTDVKLGLNRMKGNIKYSDYKHIEDQITKVTEDVENCNAMKMNEGLWLTDYNRLSNEIKILCEAVTSSAKYWKGGDK